jgi:hypothetical protein
MPGEDEGALEVRLERAVQSGVVQPAYSRLLAAVRKQCQKEDESLTLVMSRLRALVGSDQSFYGIPPSAHNAHSWHAAVEELNDLDRAVLPADKVQALLRAAKAIYHTFNADRVERAALLAQSRGAGAPPAKLGHYFLSADDFFPIFVFVLAQSSLQHLDSSRAFLWGLLDRASLNGESGYYLTVLEAALENLRAQKQVLDQKEQASLKDSISSASTPVPPAQSVAAGLPTSGGSAATVA